MIINILRIIIAIIIAMVFGKLVSKVRMPAILGWLIAGMLVGPYVLNIVNKDILNAEWYMTALNVFECSVGIMIGRELVYSKLKKSGKQLITTTLFQSLTTFLLVSISFGVIFYYIDVPLYTALILGSIALATAPAPALSIVQEYKTDGPVTRTLIPMAALDDIMAIFVFFTINAIISANNIGQSSSLLITLSIMILLPIFIGVFVGFLAGLLLNRTESDAHTLVILIGFIMLSSIIGYVFNTYILSAPVLNFMLVGMAFSATFSNLVSKDKYKMINKLFDPILTFSLIVVILSLGIPLDYRLILGSSIFTIIYIVSRALGKYFGAYTGARVSGLPKVVQKYLGLTLLTHSGVSLVFTGIAVSTLSKFDLTSAAIVSGTITAAAIINEVIAVLLSKKAFEMANEIDQASK